MFFCLPICDLHINARCFFLSQTEIHTIIKPQIARDILGCMVRLPREVNLNLSPHSLEHLPKISLHQFNSSENQHRLPEQYWLLLTLYSIAFRDFPAMLTSPFMSLVWSPSTQVGMETAFIIHYPYSCLDMKVTVNFLDWVQQCMVLLTMTTLLIQ